MNFPRMKIHPLLIILVKNIKACAQFTFIVSWLACGNRRTSRLRACSCCFLVGSSARSQCGIVHVISPSSIERARALSARTVDGDKGVEVLHGEQRVGQLPDEELQHGGGVVLLELLPREHAVVEGRLQLLAQRLVGRGLLGGG